MSLESAVRSVRDLDSLLALLREELGWPLPDRSEWSELTFEWHANELRVSESGAQRLKDGRVYQLRKFAESQPWGIFFVIFNHSRISITTLRQILRSLVSRQRQRAHLPTWNLENLLFICTTRDYDRFTFAHFRGEKAQRAVLTTFGWERGETAIHTLCTYNLENLRYPDDPSNAQQWLEQWRSAFDVQAVTEAFFRDYESVFTTIQRQLYQQTNDKAWAHDYALQLLNRLMFLYFIQRKSTPDGHYWLGNDRRFIKSFWEAYRASGEKDTFFKRWLSVLFFEAFNNKFAPKSYLSQELNDALRLAPFLNGGLFTRNELDEKYSVELPDSIFELLFDRFDGTTPGFFERYNFTISENTPLDQEVAVDPEMIGKVYESLVNITFEGLEEEDRRGSAGIFYTPRVEIDLMCRLGLVDWLTNQLGEEYKPLLYDLVFAYGPDEKNQVDDAIAQQNLWPKLSALLRDVTVCDPACGSGSFLVGMLLVLDDLQARANQQLGIEETPYERRRRIIGEQLYGVDVMDWAVHVAELRLWLQLVVETDLKPAELKFRPLLPHLSFKVRAGDSLVQELGGINFALHRKHLDIPSALKGKLTRLKAEKLKFYRSDPDDPSLYRSEGELKLAEYQLFHEILETKAQALHNEIVLLDRRIEHPAKLQTLEGIDVEDKQLELRVQEWRAQRDDWQAQLDHLQQALATLKSVHDVPFIWDIAFVEIFEGEKKGFDIVIGNPPYVRQEKIAPPTLDPDDFGGENSDRWKEQKKAYKAKLQQSVAAAWPKFFRYQPGRADFRKPDGKSDLYIYFYLHGLSLLNPKGSFCFITSNSWLDVGYGADLQEFLLRHSHVKFILDNEKKRSFAQADVNTIIALLAPPDDRTDAGLDKTARFVMFKAPFEEVLNAETFKALEAATERQSTERWRISVLSQRELLEEGLAREDDEQATETAKPRKSRAPLIKTARYEASKWGGKYLRAPDIFFTILEKGKGKLVRLGDIAEVRFGIKTGANEFFYLEPTGKSAPKGYMHVRNGAGWEGEIEKEFLKPVISSMSEVTRLVLRKSDAKTYLFSCPFTVQELKRRGCKGALSYVEWGSKQRTRAKGKHTIAGVPLPQAPTVRANRPCWYSVEPHPPGAFIVPRLIRERFFFADNPEGLSETDMFFHGYVREYPRTVSALLNCTFTYLLLEIMGRQGIEGRFNVYGPELAKVILIDPKVLTDSHRLEIGSAFSRLGKRHIAKISDELGQPDRRALDDVVFDVLGLTRGEREAVYEAVVELVRARLEKARSV